MVLCILSDPSAVLINQDFGDDHRKWGSCDPFQLFEAEIITSVAPVRALSVLCRMLKGSNLYQMV